MNVKINSEELRKVFQNQIEKQIDPDDLYLKCNVKDQFKFYKFKSRRFLGCLRTCYFCGVVCDSNHENHKEMCHSDNHRIVGLCDCTEGADFQKEYISHYNCNFSANENKKWRIWGRKFADVFTVVQKNGKDSVFEDFKDVIRADNWQIPLSNA